MRRVVITGMGIISPLGNTIEENLNKLLNGESGIGPITHFDAREHPTKIAGEVKGFDPTRYIDEREIPRMDTFIQFAIAASDEAIKDSGLEIKEEEEERWGVVIGSGIGGLESIEISKKILLNDGPRRLSPFFIPKILINLAPGFISMRHRMRGPNLSTTTACSAANHAIGEAFRMIQRGDADGIVCGGAEAAVTPLGVGGFNAMKALSTKNDEPTRASRPFDLNRDGFVMGEGSGIIVLEELEHARKRGAKIYAEMIGYGLSGDAYHITASPPDGSGAVRCMNMALRDAKVSKDDIDYINAHGTSTKLNDEIETRAIKTVFGERAREIKISSTKSMTGHLLGAAGGIEAIYSILAIMNGVIPPTINYETPDPACDLFYTPNKAIEADVKVVLSNTFGFGGTNASLVFKKFEL